MRDVLRPLFGSAAAPENEQDASSMFSALLHTGFSTVANAMGFEFQWTDQELYNLYNRLRVARTSPSEPNYRWLLFLSDKTKKNEIELPRTSAKLKEKLNSTLLEDWAKTVKWPTIPYKNWSSIKTASQFLQKVEENVNVKDEYKTMIGFLYLQPGFFQHLDNESDRNRWVDDWYKWFLAAIQQPYYSDFGNLNLQEIMKFAYQTWTQTVIVSTLQ